MTKEKIIIRKMLLLLGSLLTFYIFSACNEKARTNDNNLTDEARLEWWSEARFGMFIHWGLYAQDGCFFEGQDGRGEHNDA